MVPRRFEWIWQASEHPVPVVLDRRGLAVHQPIRANHIAAENMADALVAEADTQQRRRWAEAPDHVIGNTRFSRRAGARRNTDTLRLQLADLIQRDLVVPAHEHLGAQFAEILH